MTFLLLALAVGCGKDDKQVDPTVEQPVVVNQVVGIGKVLPKDGIALLSTDQMGIVTKLNVKMGDSIKAGQVLFELKSDAQKLDKKQALAQLETQRAKNSAQDGEIARAKIKMEELFGVYQTSKRLLAQGAETKEKTAQDESNYKQQKALYQESLQNQRANGLALRELETAVSKQNLVLEDTQYKALANGVLLRFDITLGQQLNVSSTFGELAPFGPLVIEGEVDEMYANQIQKGMQVEIYGIGQTQKLATGTLIFVGAALQNKSILYESVGEGSDRRVRRFTVALDGDQKNLLINSKVECKIVLK